MKVKASSQLQHNGHFYSAGEVFEVTPAERDELVGSGLAVDVIGKPSRSLSSEKIKYLTFFILLIVSAILSFHLIVQNRLNALTVVQVKTSGPGQTATISCESQQQITKSCGAGSDACYTNPPPVLHLSQAMCNSMGYHTGQAVNAGQCISQGENGNPTTAAGAVNLCLTVHECVHAQDNGTVSECQTEGNAYGEEGVCLAQYYNANCSPPSNGWTAAQCSDLYNQLGFAEGAGSLNSCLCTAGATCASCTAQCESGGGSIADCNSLAKIYCPEAGVKATTPITVTVPTQ